MRATAAVVVCVLMCCTPRGDSAPASHEPTQAPIVTDQPVAESRPDPIELVDEIIEQLQDTEQPLEVLLAPYIANVPDDCRGADVTQIVRAPFDTQDDVKTTALPGFLVQFGEIGSCDDPRPVARYCLVSAISVADEVVVRANRVDVDGWIATGFDFNAVEATQGTDCVFLSVTTQEPSTCDYWDEHVERRDTKLMLFVGGELLPAGSFETHYVQPHPHGARSAEGSVRWVPGAHGRTVLDHSTFHDSVDGRCYHSDRMPCDEPIKSEVHEWETYALHSDCALVMTYSGSDLDD